MLHVLTAVLPWYLASQNGDDWPRGGVGSCGQRQNKEGQYTVETPLGGRTLSLFRSASVQGICRGRYAGRHYLTRSQARSALLPRCLNGRGLLPVHGLLVDIALLLVPVGGLENALHDLGAVSLRGVEGSRGLGSLG